MRGSSFEKIKLSKLNHQKIQKTAHKGLFCLPQSNPAPAIVYGQCLLPAVVVLSYFTASEKENLRPEGKQNCVIKNEKRKKKL